MDDLKQLGRALKSERIAAGLDQAEAAAHVGVSAISLSRYENGRQKAPRAVVEQLRALYRSRGASPASPGDPIDREADRQLWMRSREREQAAKGEVEFSRQILEREKEVELELIRMGANSVEVRGFAQSIRGNPLLVAAFSGGAPATTLSNEQVMQLFEAAASGYKRIVEMLIAERDAEARRR